MIEKLNVKERLMLGMILSPASIKSNAANLRLVRKVRDELSFSEEEHKDIGIKGTPEGNITWNPAKNDTTKDVEIGEVVKTMVANKLKELDSSEGLSDDILDLYDRFVPKEKTEKKENED